MSARSVANKSGYLILVLSLFVGLCGYLFIWYLDWEESNNLKKIQAFKLKSGETLKTRVESMFPGGVWTGGELVTSYESGSKVFFWDIENDRVLAASISTIEIIPELSPQIDQAIFNTLDRNTPFDPFQFERIYPPNRDQKSTGIGN